MSSSGDIRFQEVSKRFGSVVAADRISLDVRGGEFLTLLGPSGSGKTTLLNMVLGVFDPDSGEIFVDGEPITPVPINKRNIGMVFQNYALFPHMTVHDNIAFPLRMRGVAGVEIGRRVDEMLELVQLGGLGQRYARQLSGGQQQRIATARALAASPPLVLMDEPLGALDRKLREEMQLEVRSLQRRLGFTTLYVTHDQGEAISMSDRIAVMSEGHLQQVGTPLELFETPSNLFVAGFLGNANLFRATLVAVEGNRGRLRVDGGLEFVADLPGAASIVRDDEVWVMIRPERLRLLPGAQPENDGNSFSATIREAVYGGTATRYLVEFVAGCALKVEMPSHDLPPGLEPGATVNVQWHIRDTKVLPKGCPGPETYRSIGPP